VCVGDAVYSNSPEKNEHAPPAMAAFLHPAELIQRLGRRVGDTPVWTLPDPGGRVEHDLRYNQRKSLPQL
jgi:hypothetical protein